ncbi:cupin domain-containing protein [Pedobacter yulinensis]|uniref:Cupin domain-containing protein n=2 Tax=Pedobacter yulinensis TaxID=2126353 RepID=A0A2T3HN37_9SPHI|nr:cupin domain-containing protein [Pedobacter yulinensis]
MTGDYQNDVLSTVNDHVVRIGMMTAPYFWHLHPDSDEIFLVVEGSVWVDLANRSLELLPGQLLTIPAGTPHRTRPGGVRSVNLTFESAGMTTLACEQPQADPGS